MRNILKNCNTALFITLAIMSNKWFKRLMIRINQKQMNSNFLTSIKNLLKEIKPEIKLVMGTVEYPSYFIFRFIPVEEFNNGTEIGKNHISLCVYVKEPLDWNFDKRPENANKPDRF